MVYRKADVHKHRSLDHKVWVSFKDGVYDITPFLKGHPGGSDRIMIGAGGPLEPYFEIYGFHKTDHILGFLEKFRIGDLHPDDRVK